MIFDTSYSDKEITRKIDQAVGKAFSWRERLKMKGIGSQRMQVSNISEAYRKYLNHAHYISNANIELRPKGIIIHFRHKLQAYSWIMPYSTLTVSYDQSLRLESEQYFIQFDNPKNDAFIRKMIHYQEIV